MHLRQWQQEALTLYRRYAAQGERAILWEATPGAGKTTAALQLALAEIKERGRRRVVVVVPTAHLKSQWSAAAAGINLDLDQNFRGRIGLSSDYDGVIVTYQQVANSPTVFRGLSRQAVVILDEIHHAGDGLTWGDALRTAFASAGFILCLSGTAFRSDNAAIPFIDYSKRGESRPDYSYPYSRAISDQVCRPVAFFTYGGELSWQEGGQIIEANFNDDLYGSLAARRLRVALDVESGWVTPMLKEAHHMLQEIRREHSEAGGLLVAADQTHARQLAQLLFELTGKRPAVALSDDAAASRKIKRFSRSREEWIVACNMVSEGVDIPRLRVGVYATTISTKMYFRQFLGRMVRVTPQPDGMQVAYVYLPADTRLKRLAEEVEDEQRHLLKRRPDGQWDLPDRVTAAENGGEPGWSALYSTNSGLEAVIVNGQQLALFGDPSLLPTPNVVRQQVHEKVEERILTRSERKAVLGQQIKSLVARLHHHKGRSHREIHAALNRIQDVPNQQILTEKQLQSRVGLLQKMLR